MNGSTRVPIPTKARRSMRTGASSPLTGVLQGLAAAVLFGVSTPLAKTLLGSLPPLLLAGVL